MSDSLSEAYCFQTLPGIDAACIKRKGHDGPHYAIDEQRVEWFDDGGRCPASREAMNEIYRCELGAGHDGIHIATVRLTWGMYG